MPSVFETFQFGSKVMGCFLADEIEKGAAGALHWTTERTGQARRPVLKRQSNRGQPGFIPCRLLGSRHSLGFSGARGLAPEVLFGHARRLRP